MATTASQSSTKSGTSPHARRSAICADQRGRLIRRTPRRRSRRWSITLTSHDSCIGAPLAGDRTRIRHSVRVAGPKTLSKRANIAKVGHAAPAATSARRQKYASARASSSESRPAPPAAAIDRIVRHTPSLIRPYRCARLEGIAGVGRHRHAVRRALAGALRSTTIIAASPSHRMTRRCGRSSKKSRSAIHVVARLVLLRH